MISKLLFSLVALGCYAYVQGRNLTVKFAENDIIVDEEVGSLDFTLNIQGNQDNGDIVFGVETLTASQYLDQPDLCQSEFSGQFSDALSKVDPAELDDLSVNTVNCTRTYDQRTNDDITCSFPINNDGSFEGDEFLVLVLRVIDTAGNLITLERKCAIATITQDDTEQFELDLLSSLQRPITVTEGQENFFLTIEKNFLTEFPIEITFLITSDLTGTDYRDPSLTDGVDYSLNGGERSAVILANETHINIPVNIIDDDKIEVGERFEIEMTANFIGIHVQGVDLFISPMEERILILDNDVVTVGFDTPELSLNVLEGEDLRLCVIVRSHVWLELERDIEVNIFTENGTATSNTHFITTTPSSQVERILGLYERVCINIQTIDDDIILERSRTLTVKVQDAGLIQLTDPADIQAHQALNVVDPSCVTVTIDDNDGIPAKPNITKIGAEVKDDLIFEWDVNQDQGLREVDCFYGNITVTASIDMDTDKPDKGGNPTEETRRETTTQFDFCPGGKDTTLTIPDIEDNKQYAIVVCARNRFGDNCSEPLVYVRVPPPPQQVTVSPGLIAGVIVAVVVVVLCCCLIFILCLLLCLCGRERERRYFPQKRERQLAKEFGHRHLPQHSISSFSDDEFEETKEPL